MGQYSREGTIFIAGTFASSSIKQRKTEPKVSCKHSRLHRNRNKTCDFVPENTSAKQWPRTLAKEHQTCTWAWLQDRGGGGTIQERALFFTGTLFEIGHYSREGSNRASTVCTLGRISVSATVRFNHSLGAVAACMIRSKNCQEGSNACT